ncbi:MAG TPA: hypothetical protein VGK34_04940, partial [Armatimonadota bacterium]
TVRVRNDGPATWAKGSNASVDCWRIRTYYPDISQDTPPASSITPLTEDVEPGRTIEISLPVKFPSASNEESDVLYGMIWTVPDPGGDRSSYLNWSDFQPVSTAGDDNGQKFVSQDIPREMRGGRKFPVNITLRNAGAEVWMKSSAALTFKWFGLDGIPVQDLAGSITLPNDMQPGEEMTLKATVTAPSYDGRYNIVWDLNTTGKQITSPASVSRGDLIIFPVQIIKGKTAGASK